MCLDCIHGLFFLHLRCSIFLYFSALVGWASLLFFLHKVYLCIKALEYLSVLLIQMIPYLLVIILRSYLIIKKERKMLIILYFLFIVFSVQMIVKMRLTKSKIQLSFLKKKHIFFLRI